MSFKKIAKNINNLIRSLRYKYYIKYLQLFQNRIFDPKKLSSIDNSLTNVMNKYYSDKGDLNFTHNYTCFYDSIFNEIKNEKLNIFEVGLGSIDTNITFHMSYSHKNYAPLASLKAWRDYFINSEIYGADIDEKILLNSERINTFQVDMLNSNSIKSMWEKINKKMDIIIDDGFHSYEANINFYKYSINNLNENGIYIIEDVHRKPSNIIKFYNFFKKNDVKFQILDLDHSKNFKDNCLIIIKR